MRRSAVLKRFKQEAEARFCLFGVQANCVEYSALNLRRINADRTAAQLIAVNYEVVGA